jgi:choline-sulfatase
MQNIIVVMLDDHAQWALGCYGNSEIHSPTVDYLAATGTRMANAFTPTPVCSPSRACFFTGTTSSQHGVHDFIDPQNPETDGREWLHGQVTLPELLHDAGYTTALCGKWHLGSPATRRPGFDYWYEQEQPGGAETAHVDGPWKPRAETETYDRHAIVDRAVDFLRQRDATKPFFLFVGLYTTHSPWRGHPERIVSQYRTCTFDDIPADAAYPFGRRAAESIMPDLRDHRETRAQYYASVTALDEQVGRLIDELDDQGLRSETLVVYTSDHGLNMGHHGVWGKGNATKPYNMLEESIRVPLVFNQPGRITNGTPRQEMVTHCDLFATLADLAGVDIPAKTSGGQGYPGRSYRALLEGGHVSDWPQRVIGEYGNLRMIRTRTHKLVTRHPDGPDELFDLASDPRETTNVIGDPRNEVLAGELRAQVEQYFAAYEDPRRSGLIVNSLPSFNAEEMWRHPDSDNRWWETTTARKLMA